MAHKGTMTMINDARIISWNMIEEDRATAMPVPKRKHLGHLAETALE
jgi:hypothetical protein